MEDQDSFIIYQAFKEYTPCVPHTVSENFFFKKEENISYSFHVNMLLKLYKNKIRKKL